MSLWHNMKAMRPPVYIFLEQITSPQACKASELMTKDSRFPLQWRESRDSSKVSGWVTNRYCRRVHSPLNRAPHSTVLGALVSSVITTFDSKEQPG